MMRSSIIRHNGQLMIDIDGKKYPALAFKSFRPNPKNVSEFHEAGLRLFTALSSGIISGLGIPYSLYGESWTGPGQYDFAPIDRQMEMFMENSSAHTTPPKTDVCACPSAICARFC